VGQRRNRESRKYFELNENEDMSKVVGCCKNSNEGDL